jgi:dihydropteroate synthase
MVRKYVRVHDVAETRDALAVLAAVETGSVGNEQEILRH